MITENGKLPFGIEKDGTVHRNYSLREQVVADAIDVFESSDAARAERSDSYYGVCVMSKRLSVLGLPQQDITPTLIMGMRQDDFNELAAADKRLKAKRLAFRDAAEAAAKDSAGSDEAGV